MPASVSPGKILVAPQRPALEILGDEIVLKEMNKQIAKLLGIAVEEVEARRNVSVV